MPNDPPGFAAQLAEDLSPEDVVHVLSLLQGDIARLVAELEAAASAGDPAAFRAAAHGIAGAAGSVGAADLEQAGRRAMTNRDPAAPLPGPAAEIRGLADAMLREIAGFLAAGTPPALP